MDKWYTKGFSEKTKAEWEKYNFSLSDALNYRNKGIKYPKEAAEWRATRVDNPEEWKNFGFNPDDTMFWKNDFTPLEAAKWESVVKEKDRHGYASASFVANEWHKYGFTPDDYMIFNEYGVCRLEAQNWKEIDIPSKLFKKIMYDIDSYVESVNGGRKESAKLNFDSKHVNLRLCLINVLRLLEKQKKLEANY